MAQFDVHANKGALRETIPFVVIVQSSLFDAYKRRIVVPLVRKNVAADAASVRARVNPVFKVRNTEVVLNPLDIVSVSVDQLGPRVGSLSSHGQAICDALDEVLTRSWG